MDESAYEIREDPPTRVTQTVPAAPQPTFPGAGFQPPAGMPMPDPSQISDGQLDMMKGMMSTPDGRSMIRNMMKSQTGMDMTDEQLNMMGTMMNRDTLQMASAQMKNNPDMMNQLPRNGGVPNPAGLGTQTTPFPGGAGGGMPANPTGMEDMMKKMQSGEQPGFDDLLKNKDMFKMVFGMMKSNPSIIKGITSPPC